MVKNKTDNGPGRDYFGVTKLNRQQKGGLSIEYTAMYPNGEDDFEEESDKKKSSRVPVDEFLTEVTSLKKFVAKVLNYSNILNVTADPKLEVTAKQSKVITSLYNDFVGKITVNGIKLWMTGTMVTACEIHYSLAGFNTQSMDQSTYKIDVSEGCDNTHGFEDELRESLQKIVSHSYEYIYNRMGAQLQTLD